MQQHFKPCVVRPPTRCDSGGQFGSNRAISTHRLRRTSSTNTAFAARPNGRYPRHTSGQLGRSLMLCGQTDLGVERFCESSGAVVIDRVPAVGLDERPQVVSSIRLWRVDAYHAMSRTGLALIRLGL